MKIHMWQSCRLTCLSAHSLFIIFINYLRLLFIFCIVSLHDFSQAQQSLQPWLCSDGGRDHECQPYKVQVSRSWPACHGHQPLWTQDPSAHGQSPHHYRGTDGSCCSPQFLLITDYFQRCVWRVSLSHSRTHTQIPLEIWQYSSAAVKVAACLLMCSLT